MDTRVSAWAWSTIPDIGPGPGHDVSPKGLGGPPFAKLFPSLTSVLNKLVTELNE